MIRPKDYSSLPESVLEGIRFHQHIDSYTDKHMQVLISKGRIRHVAGKYAPVLVDVYYDYTMSMNWDRYATLSFSNFEQEIYSILSEAMTIIPLSLQTQVKSMVDHKWLRTYQSELGINQVFNRMAHRTSKPEKLLQSIDVLFTNHQDLDYDFNQFFPELISHCHHIYPLRNSWLTPV